ncbi:hypothetical protein RYX36_015927, partial [Vicia faba]
HKQFYDRKQKTTTNQSLIPHGQYYYYKPRQQCYRLKFAANYNWLELRRRPAAVS